MECTRNRGRKLNQTTFHTLNTQHVSIDKAFIARIASEVVRRLRTNDRHSKQPTSDQQVISVATIQQSAESGQTKLIVKSKAVITPAAQDEAKKLGVMIEIAAPSTNTRHSLTNNLSIRDSQDTSRAQNVIDQLERRGISGNASIILSNRPAADVCRICIEDKEQAVCIGSVADVQRFATELNSPTWVLDMNQLNLIAAVNVVQRILARTDQSSSTKL